MGVFSTPSKQRCQRLRACLVTLAFVIEVVNPTTVFVREGSAPFHSQKASHAFRKTLHTQAAHAANEAAKPSDPARPSGNTDDEDYIVSSADVPVYVFLARPVRISLFLVPPAMVHFLEVFDSIYRPPMSC